jgi:virginiamycin B lyase
MRNQNCLWCAGLLLALGSTGSAQYFQITEYSNGITAGSGLSSITQGPDGAMWFTEVTGSRIGRITAAGVVTEYSVSPASPQSIVAGPDGNLWFTSEYSVGRITPAGVVTTYDFLTTGSVPGTGGTGITVGPNGEDIWFLDQSTNQVGHLSIAAGAVTNEYLVPTPAAFLYRIAAGPDGNLWFTEYNTNKIGRITTAGSITEFPGPPYGCPRGITAGPDGALWFADCSGSIDRITTAGVITQYSSGLIIGADPIGIAQGPGGSIWFADYGNNAVGRVNLGNGTITEYKTGISPNASVVAIAGGSAGMWFVENAYSQIGAITAPNPSINSGGVVSAASFAAVPVAPGEVVSIFGQQIGPTTPAFLTLDSTGKVATSIGGVSVTFGSHLAPLTYVGAGQINAVVPYEVAGSSSVGVTVNNNGFQSSNATVQLAATGPSIFTLNGSGTGPGAILNQDFSVNSQSNPAPKGSVIQIYMTGEGITTPAQADGAVTIATSAFPYTPTPQAAVSVNIGGQPAQLQWAGEAPDFVAGVLQVNATIPATAASGANPIVVKIGSNASQSGVTVWVR